VKNFGSIRLSQPQRNSTESSQVDPDRFSFFRIGLILKLVLFGHVVP